MEKKLGLLLVLAAAVPATADFRVPLFKTPPKVDGTADAKEWAGAAAFTGFVSLKDGKMERRRVRAFVGASEETIFIAMQSQLPDEGAMTAAVTTDSLKAVFDNSLEIYVNPTPGAPDRVDYQYLVNHLGKGGYNIHKIGSPAEGEAWQGGWKSAHSLKDGWWSFECAIPIASMKLVAPGRKTTDGVWAINLTRNWQPDWGWSSLSGGYANSGLLFVFTKSPAPAVGHGWSGDPTFPPAELTLSVANPSTAPLPVKAAIVLTRNNMPELVVEKDLKPAPGAVETVSLPLDAKDPTTVYEMKVRATSPDDSVVYYERPLSWKRADKPHRWALGKPKDVPPVDFEFAYYPSLNKIRIAPDIANLPKRAVPRRVVAVVRTRLEKKEIAKIVFAMKEFSKGRAGKAAVLPPLEGLYEIAVRAEGKNCPAAPIVKEFERKIFPWETLPTGRSTKVYPPFTPLKLEGNRLSAVLRTYDLNAFGLWDQTTATAANTRTARTVLAGPMRYRASAGGKPVEFSAGPMKTALSRDDRVVLEGSFSGGPVKAAWTTAWDYDGSADVSLTLQPGGGTVDALTLEIPFSDATAPFIHANADRIRAPIAHAVPAGTGVVWDSTKVAGDEPFFKTFCPYVYMGSAVRGLCWFAENDKGWGWDPKTPNLDIVRQGDRVTLRIHLVNRPTEIAAPRTIRFGLLAAPVKPMLNAPGANPNWWRYRYQRDRYSLLGTDINWFGNHSCGTVYPVGQDLYLWEALSRGNRERMSAAEIEAVRLYGRKHFAHEGAEALDTWDRHVRHNLQSRFGTKMVFYYNRGTCQELEEFETFKDEWLLTDYRTVGKGKGRGEIKLVPSESYINYALYWYARSFETGNNTGVYWDNMFIAPDFNTAMTDAYRRPDGTIVPAAGIRGLRELVRRTFVMMNERGMLPITFPHMTSFNLLPVMAFSTVQYDWEWKYSLGDVQDRHSREYILLATTGELAGVWPVPLGDHGRLGADPWTQRTFLAVRLVHELEGGGGIRPETAKAWQAVERMLDLPGMVVYKYWEDRPLPARTNNPDLPAIVYSVPGKEALVIVTSYSRKDETVPLAVDAKTLGMEKGFSAADAETGAPLPATGATVSFPLKKHDMKLIRLTPAQ